MHACLQRPLIKQEADALQKANDLISSCQCMHALKQTGTQTLPLQDEGVLLGHIPWHSLTQENVEGTVSCTRAGPLVAVQSAVHALRGAALPV